MFMSPETVRSLADRFGTPLFVYSERLLRLAAERALAVQAPFGCTVRYAMKANSTRGILKLFQGMGLHIDASSAFEAYRAKVAGFGLERILLTSQEVKPDEVAELSAGGMKVNASSLRQLETLLACQVESSRQGGRRIGLRINPGVGSGGHDKTVVGGPYAGFGIWHQDLPKATALCRAAGVTIERLHFHIGSGSDAQKVSVAADRSLLLMEKYLPEVETLNIGGGFAVDRLTGSSPSDLNQLLQGVFGRLTAFYGRTGRAIHLEIEPGTYLVASAGALLCAVLDVKETSHVKFMVVDAGLTEIMRPALYGSGHPIETVRCVETGRRARQRYRVIGHCCESGDTLTVRPDQVILGAVSPGDLVVVGGTGAYCASMSAKNYNSFPEAAEVLLGENGAVRLIRQRQTFEQLVQNEL
jgi:diaminopimelate decarboxylase